MKQKGFIFGLLLFVAFAFGRPTVTVSRRGPSSKTSSSPYVHLVVAYCPTDFTGAGALVKVDPVSGAFTIAAKFDWPQTIFGCPLLYDPTITFDHIHERIFLDFLSAFGFVTEVDLNTGKVVHHQHPTDPFFTGFNNMAFKATLGVGLGSLIGTSPTVTQSGFCSDGCFDFGGLQVGNGNWKRYALLPFKALLDDSHYYDQEAFWVQGSYDLRPAGQACYGSGANSTQCLLQIDPATGALISSKPITWTAYKYAAPPKPGQATPSHVMAWANMGNICNDPYNDFAFANVSLADASAQIVSCISANTTVHMDEWVAAFSPDQTMMATASGDTEAPAQLLVFHAPSATVLLNSDLKGVAQALGAAEKMFDVWGVAFF